MIKRRPRWMSEAAEQMIIDWLTGDDESAQSAAGDASTPPAASLGEEKSGTTPPAGDARPEPRIGDIGSIIAPP